MRKSACILSLLLFFSILLSGQDQKKNHNALLWKISGNGLQKSSYLFGTMHITDKRVFHFSDSLYHFIEKSEGFATELDMTSIMMRYLNDILGGNEGDDTAEVNDSPDYLADMLDEKTLARYKAALEKKLKKPVDKIRVSDLEKVNDKWMEDMFRNGDMPTFMDAYLFDIARRQGKWVGGIEDFEDQFGILDVVELQQKLEALISDEKDKKDALEWMISTYLKEDLNAIDRSEAIWQGTKDIILIKRNKKMAIRIDSLAGIRSTFFAVGAAHIPGEEGVVNLLRQKGFSVEPVYSDTRISPEKYAYEEKELSWHGFSVSDSAYSLETPGPAEPLKMLADFPFDARLFFDIGSMRAFFTMGIPITGSSEVPEDSLINKLTDFFTAKAKNVLNKEIRAQDLKGIEYNLVDEDSTEVRMQVFVSGGFVAVNVIAAFKKQVLTDRDAERFFSSFKVNAKKEAEQKNRKDRWQTYTYTDHGFEVDLPLRFKEKKEKDENPEWQHVTMQAFDLVEQTFYGMAVYTIRKGYFSSDDSSTFESIAANLLENMDAKPVKSYHTTRNGYPAYESFASIEDEGKNVWFRMLLVHKGARRYLLFTTSDDMGEPEALGKRFFSSFRLISPPVDSWKMRSSPDNSFSIWSPGDVEYFYELKTNPYEIKYHITEPVNKLQISIDKDIFPSYYWTGSDSTLLRNRINNFYTEEDSLVFYKTFREGDMPGVDLLIHLANTHNRKRMKIFLNGDTLYSVYCFIPDEFIHSPGYEKLFSSFRISNPVKPFDFLTRKPQAFLEALKTKDSLEFEMAKIFLGEMHFTADDLPLLQQAMLHLNLDFDSLYYYNSNKTIADLVEALDSNHTSVVFFRENYKQMTPENEYAKPWILGLLSNIKTRESYELLADLLINHPPAINKTFYFSNGISDSLELSRILYPGIIRRAGHPGLFDMVNDHMLLMLDSSIIDIAMVSPYKDEFIKSTRRMLQLPEESLTETSYQYYSLVKLLGKINHSETNQLLKKVVDLKDNRLRLLAILALAENNQLVDHRDIYTLATLDEYRLELYEGLKKIRKEKLFPPDYLNQRRLGQSKLYAYADEEDYPPQMIDYIGERIETFMGKKQKFYLYKLRYSYDMEQNMYLGVAGPYSLNTKDLNSNHEVTGIYWDEEFDEKRINEYLKELISQAEEWLRQKEN